MLIGMLVCHNTDGIADGPIIIDLFAVNKLSGIPNNVTVVRILGDNGLPDALSRLSIYAKADLAIELCHRRIKRPGA